MRIRVRLFAIQRELAGDARGRPRPGRRRDGRRRLGGARRRHPALAPGRDFVRFARNGAYADADDAPRGRRRGGDDPAGVGRGGASRRRAARILELRATPFDATILAELTDRLATAEDGAVVGFLGRTRATPGTPGAGPGGRGRPPRRPGGRVARVRGPRVDGARASWPTIADEIAARFGVERLAIVHRTGDVPLGEASIAVVAVAPHRDAAFEAARYAIDETKARAPIWKAERFDDGHVWIGHRLARVPRAGVTLPRRCAGRPSPPVADRAPLSLAS